MPQFRFRGGGIDDGKEPLNDAAGRCLQDPRGCFLVHPLVESGCGSVRSVVAEQTRGGGNQVVRISTNA